MSLLPGLYDLLITESVARSLETAASLRSDVTLVSPEDLPDRLASALGDQLRTILADVEQEPERGIAQLTLVNALLVHVRTLARSRQEVVDPVAQPAVLRALHTGDIPPSLPETGLAAPWLFTAGRGSPALLAELRREAAECDQIDILVSFITLSGIRKLIDILTSVTAADAAGRGRTRIRVLTTTYMGVTELAALDHLAALNGCEVRISLDGRRTRLHAKAWIFHRRTGFGSAYVGSANLSHVALAAGLEWTVKFTERGQTALYDRAKAHFDTLWLDEEFTQYRPNDADFRAAVGAALRQESSGAAQTDGALTTFFDLQPKPYQRDMLEQLAREREHGRTRNLVVAATGTGKTVVAAFDYRATVDKLGGQRPRLLFVAHREQILQQALATYQHVLRDGSFGELLVGGREPRSYDHLFASIDSLTTRGIVERLGPDHWHTVVIDECHRIAASRFDRLATTIEPAILLGLTATPERSDGRPISPYFQQRPDGSSAVELRLWDALDMQLLAPFEYFGCDDATDFSDVPWNAAGEVAAIDRLVTGNDVRARTIINEWRRLAGDPQKGKALVFCVSVAHARYMTAKLNEAGIPAECVVGESSAVERARALRRLNSGEVGALVTVDLYNEGVDLPDVDTLLLLRPTQSPVLFQQQLGRGLRLAPGKESCLVLDFVGQHRAEFRFDRLLGGITGLTRRQLIDAVENGFSALPPGCHIQLQRQTREQVLRSLRSLVGQSWRRLQAELQAYVATTGRREVQLGDFLYEQQVDLAEVYRDSAPSGWTTLRRGAGLLTGAGSDDEARLSRRFGDLLHADDVDYLQLIRHVAERPARFEPQSDFDAKRAQMLTYQVDSSREAMSYREWVQVLERNPACAEELDQLADVLIARSRMDARPVPGLEDAPLAMHARYRIREILAAIGYHTAVHRGPMQAGVLPLTERRVELLFVTLDKSSGFHDRIAYSDYAMNPSRFHWQTQNTAGPDTPAGRRYLDSGTNGWRFQLFVRNTKADAYHPCGPVRLYSLDDVRGDRPMSIEWTLEVPLPSRLFAEFSVLRGQA